VPAREQGQKHGRTLWSRFWNPIEKEHKDFTKTGVVPVPKSKMKEVRRILPALPCSNPPKCQIGSEPAAPPGAPAAVGLGTNNYTHAACYDSRRRQPICMIQYFGGFGASMYLSPKP